MSEQISGGRETETEKDLEYKKESEKMAYDPGDHLYQNVHSLGWVVIKEQFNQ